MADLVEKSVDLKASFDRVWKALTDPEEFGTWFRVKFDGPFVVGETTTGQMTYPGSEHYRWISKTVTMDRDTGIFAFTGVHAADPANPTEDDPSTLVEFRLEKTPEGCRLTVRESGFNALPPDRRDEAMRDNEQGWEIQTGNVKAYVES